MEEALSTTLPWRLMRPLRHGRHWLTSAIATALTGLVLICFSPRRPTARPTSAATTTPVDGKRSRHTHALWRRARTLNLVDDSRGTPANGSAPALPSRNLSTWVLYPAVGAPTAQPIAHAQPASDGKPFPVIVFAHGLDSLGLAYDPLLQQWVERGFVVVAPTFPLSNIAAPGGDTAKDLVNQPGDMSFVLTQVLDLSKQSGNLLSGMIDPHRIAAVGHSLGAMTVLAWTENTCCEDPGSMPPSSSTVRRQPLGKDASSPAAGPRPSLSCTEPQIGPFPIPTARGSTRTRPSAENFSSA